VPVQGLLYLYLQTINSLQGADPFINCTPLRSAEWRFHTVVSGQPNGYIFKGQAELSFDAAQNSKQRSSQNYVFHNPSLESEELDLSSSVVKKCVPLKILHEILATFLLFFLLGVQTGTVEWGENGSKNFLLKKKSISLRFRAYFRTLCILP